MKRKGPTIIIGSGLPENLVKDVTALVIKEIWVHA